MEANIDLDKLNELIAATEAKTRAESARADAERARTEEERRHRQASDRKNELLEELVDTVREIVQLIEQTIDPNVRHCADRIDLATEILKMVVTALMAQVGTSGEAERLREMLVKLNAPTVQVGGTTISAREMRADRDITFTED